MAFMRCSFFSLVLETNTDINVIMPTISSDEIMNKKDTSWFHKDMRYQVLYLLHGAYGDYSDWIRHTGIERYAHEKRLAVVMPSAANSFYQDMHQGLRYLTYLTEELPSFVQTMFPISGKREDTFVAGLSMGGYGALKLAFAKPENYAACASLSGGLDLAFIKNGDDQIVSPVKWDSIFEDPSKIAGTDADLFALIEKRKKEGRLLPRIFQSCGAEDFLYKSNASAHEKLVKLGVDITYEEHPGIHDWNYWDKHIQRVLNWLC
jgi:S-formylglutathione hydrolase FrmB